MSMSCEQHDKVRVYRGWVSVIMPALDLAVRKLLQCHQTGVLEIVDRLEH